MGSDRDDKQSSSAHEQLELLCLIARIHGIAADPQLLQHQLALDEKSFPGFAALKLAAKHLGLKARQELVQTERLRFTPLPAIAKLVDGSWAIAAANDTHVVVQYPTGTKSAGPVQLPLEEFHTLWTGSVPTQDLTRTATTTKSARRGPVLTTACWSSTWTVTVKSPRPKRSPLPNGPANKTATCRHWPRSLTASRTARLTAEMSALQSSASGRMPTATVWLRITNISIWPHKSEWNMKSNRFSKESLIDRYFKRIHGYLLILYIIFALSEVVYLFGGPRLGGGQILSNLAKKIEPIFFEYSMLVLLLIINAVIVIHAEFFQSKTEGVAK